MDDSVSAAPNPPPEPPSKQSGGPRRIRSLPDRPAGGRAAGTVRSLPAMARTSARLPGTYAASFGEEKSWRRGLGILWALFLLTMLMEMFNAVFYLLAGKIGWPPLSHLMLGGTDQILPLETGRLALVCTLFVGLWVGWGWLRYVLATVDFLFGAWFLVSTLASYYATPRFRATGITEVPLYSAIESSPKIALGILYLVTAAYVIFSHDVLEFVAHRRAHGRLWSALLVTMVSYGCLIVILGGQPLYNLWLNTQRPGAMAFGEDTLRTVSQSWAGDSIDSRIDSEFAKIFTPSARKSSFENFKALGQLQSAHNAPLILITTTRSHPLQNIIPAPADVATQVTRDGNGFQVYARYEPTVAVFEHGRVRFGFDLVRDLFGPWRIRGLDAREVSIERPPTSTPPDTAPSATPAPTAPAVAPMIPSASPTPAIPPVPSTGG